MIKSDEERIAVLEVQVRGLEVQLRDLSTKFENHAIDTRAENQKIEAKMDELIALKNKGMGAFWFASVIIGSGIMGSIALFVSWIKGM